LIQNEINKNSIDIVQKAIVLLCLDDSSPQSLDEITGYLHWGGKDQRKNRYYDKPLQVVVFKNGRGGINGEHSLSDGQPIAILLNWIIEKEDLDTPPFPTLSEALPPPQHLKWVLDDLKIQLNIASTNLDKLANNINQTCFDYNAYGKHIASKIMKTSPDAVVQLALQLAYYGQQGTFCGVYESVSMRHYKRGRTETGRCLSVESKAFVLAMVDSKVSQEEKKRLFHEAARSHVNYLSEAKKGNGIDRHFLGLKLLTLENGEELHPLFKDPVFQRSCSWNLSTSQLEFKYIKSIGFGPVLPDGYGICYGIRKDSIHFYMTSWKDCPTMDVHNFRQRVTEALDGFRKLLSEPSAKL